MTSSGGISSVKVEGLTYQDKSMNIKKSTAKPKSKRFKWEISERNNLVMLSQSGYPRAFLPVVLGENR